MSRSNMDRAGPVCPKTGRQINGREEHRCVSWALPFVGALSVLWFLIRVVPKPSRATYPCQRLAAPIASGFVVWLVGIAASALAYRRAKRLAGQARYVVAGVFAAIAVGALWWSISLTADKGAGAAFAPIDAPNSPIGVGKGIYPGRVVWVHDPTATTWDGATGNWWDDRNLDQRAVDDMVARGLRALTGQPNDAAAWDAIFRYFNRTHNAGDVGYQLGEKIAIKINMNQDTGAAWAANAGMPSPQMIHSLLAQLFHVVHVPGSAVTIYDAARYIGDPIYDRIHGDADPNFQSVTFVCSTTRNGRSGAVYDPAHPIHFANPSVPGNATAYLPRCVTEAKYLINMALFRAHQLFGVTACGKNLFGSIYWPSNGGWTPAPLHNFGSRDLPMGSYNCLVDLIGHPQLGGKTLLYLVDGLYGARHQNGEVIRYSSFGNDWTASLFVSQDPLAIDSVVLDFLRNEPLATDCTGPGVDNYLHEAAQANSPPSRSVYDPGGTGTRLASLGVHEHWNNAVEKKYSRNLARSEGIELVMPSLAVTDGPVSNAMKQTKYNHIRDAVQEASDGDGIVVAAGVYQETLSFNGKALWIASTDPLDPNMVAATVIQGATEGVAFTNGENAKAVLQGFTIRGAARGVYCEGAAPIIDHCRIVDNQGAGIKLWAGSNPMIVNCIITGNGGDGIEMSAAQEGRRVTYNYATILYCDILGNRGAGIRGSKPIVNSTIVRSNVHAPGMTQISADAPIVTYSDVEGGCPGTGNIDADPDFVVPGHWADPADPTKPAAAGDTKAIWIAGDYHLRASSPCIDAGDPLLPLTSVWVAFDIEGFRPVGNAPDIGCHEFGSLPCACRTQGSRR